MKVPEPEKEPAVKAFAAAAKNVTPAPKVRLSFPSDQIHAQTTDEAVSPTMAGQAERERPGHDADDEDDRIPEIPVARALNFEEAAALAYFQHGAGKPINAELRKSGENAAQILRAADIAPGGPFKRQRSI